LYQPSGIKSYERSETGRLSVENVSPKNAM
jgi:hypothetical protein